jgi:AcrR family transcriptional regulator
MGSGSRRSAEVEATRRRIAASALELHGTVGPSRTTISEIARRAGVDRVTVYRHFPDDAALFGACSEEFAAQHPLPDIDDWDRYDEPESRAHMALQSIYAYYAENEALLANVTRDAEQMPALRAVGARRTEWLQKAERRIAAVFGRSTIVRHAVALAIDFRTWELLVRRRGLAQSKAIDLMVAMIATAAGRTSA